MTNTTKQMAEEVIDLKDMPRPSPVTNGEDSVSKGLVDLSHAGKPTCHKHKAMLCVSPDRRIWRCPTCNVGCYVSKFTPNP